MFSRLAPKASSERLWKYWQKMTSATVDRVSGLVTIRVLAFSADDALALAKEVQASAERMVDATGSRAREDALRAAQEDLSRARRRYADALLGLRHVREDERIVNPAKTIDGLAATLLEAIREKLKLETERDVSLKILSPTAPQLRVLTERLQALEDQI